MRLRITGLFLSSLLIMQPALANLKIDIAYLSLHVDSGPVLSNILPLAEDVGQRGAELAINDNNTTGRFLKHHYRLTPSRSESQENLFKKAQDLYRQGQRLFVLDLPTEALTQLAQQLGNDALLFNARAQDNRLRTEQCQTNVLHTIPSRAMLTDALAQWLKAKRLTNLLLITGSTPEDEAYAASVQRSANRFGLKIVQQKNWSFDTDLRRTAQKEMPLFTQAKDYDVVVVADERGDFGEYVLYNTWLPRPVVGTQGLQPVAWHRVVEQWGAAQLQRRFQQLSERWMHSRDYASWAAVRAIAEAVTRTNSNQVTTLRDYLFSDQFQLAGFKGRKLNFRSWNGQLRQPISLIHPRSLVSQSPQEGFLHPISTLDTLGYDQSESRCRMHSNSSESAS